MRTPVRPNGPVHNEDAIVVNIPRFKAYLTQYEIDLVGFVEEFRLHRILEISYESLSSNTEKSICSILDFLDVDRRPLRMQTLRQSSGNVMQRIVNLDEVVAAYRGTRWESVPDSW